MRTRAPASCAKRVISGYGIDRAEDVADMGDGDKARTFAKQGAVSIHIDLTYGRQGDDTQMRPATLAHHLPRHDIRVVLHRADDDLIASGDEASPAEDATRLMASRRDHG